MLMLGSMGYADKLQKLCVLRGLDQAALAFKVNRSKSSISRILSGEQEPKLKLAHELAKVLGVTLDFLADDEMEYDPSHHLVVVTDDEMTILKIVRRLGTSSSIDRLLIAPGASATTGKVESAREPSPFGAAHEKEKVSGS